MPIVRFQIPAQNDRGPKHAEPIFAALLESLARLRPLELRFETWAGQVGLSVDLPKRLATTFADQLQNAFPGVSIDNSVVAPAIQPTWSACLRLAPTLLSLKQEERIEDRMERTRVDPLAGLLAALRPAKGGSITASVRLQLRRPGYWVHRRAFRQTESLERGFRAHWQLEHYLKWSSDRRYSVRMLSRVFRFVCRSGPLCLSHDSFEHKSREGLAATTICIEVTANDRVEAHAKIHEVAAAFAGFTEAPGRFILGPIRWHQQTLLSRVIQRYRRSEVSLLSAADLALLWRPPETNAIVPRLQTSHWKELPGPVHLPSPDTDDNCMLLGQVKFRSDHRLVGLRQTDYRRHVYCVGKTGMGKSTLLLTLLTHEIRKGRAVCLIDPHGDLSEMLRANVPRRRKNDILWFDAGDREHPQSFNPLADTTAKNRPLVADAVLVALRRQFGEFFGPRMEDILRNALLAILESPNPTLFDVQRLLVEPGFRRTVVGRITDVAVRSFWVDTFSSWNDRYRTEAIAPVENKLRSYLSNPILRKILCQPRNRLNLRQIIDRGSAILIVNLSKGRVGEDGSSLLGSLILSFLQLAAMSRADIPEHQRADITIAVDEFQSFVAQGNSTFATSLSESRKFRTSYILSHQYLGQLDEATQAAVLGNVGTLISFQIGPTDAEVIATQLGQPVTPEDLLRLPKYHAYARLLIDGTPSLAMSMMTIDQKAKVLL